MAQSGGSTVSRTDRLDEPGPADQDPSAVENRHALRNRLAQLLGRLLARFWLRLQASKEGARPREDPRRS
jgi:hypothetical protein